MTSQRSEISSQAPNCCLIQTNCQSKHRLLCNYSDLVRCSQSWSVRMVVASCWGKVALHGSSSFCQSVCVEAVSDYVWLVDTNLWWMTPVHVTVHLKVLCKAKFKTKPEKITDFFFASETEALKVPFLAAKRLQHHIQYIPASSYTVVRWFTLSSHSVCYSWKNTAYESRDKLLFTLTQLC